MSNEVDLVDLERYLRIYQENPDSRVFAPLADMYRRLARYREAEQVAREGLMRNPYYAGGKVALAHILLDTERLQEAVEIIEEIVTFYPDNLLARRILIKVLAGLNYWERAEREYSAYRVISPSMAEDPELVRILQSRGRSLARQVPSASVKASTSLRSASPEKLLLLKKKQVLETWLKNLEAGRV